MTYTTDERARLGLRESATFDRQTIAAIQRAAETGIYDIRGWGAKRRLPHFDDLLFLGASMSRYPLEGYRERCGTDVVLGDRFAKHPLHLDIPVTIAGMSFGALSGPAKEALGRGASEVGTSTTTGDGGMTPEERGQSKYLVYQYLPSRYGMNPDDLRKADAIEVVLGQGAKPGGGGMLLGQKISERVAGMRTLPEGIDQRSACRHPDWTGPDDLTIKINELREITDWEKPIYVKVGATRTYYDVKLAVHAGADVVVVDGMQGGTAATQEVFIEHVGIPTLAAVPQAVQALAELGVHQPRASGGSPLASWGPTRPGGRGTTGQKGVQLIVSGGIRTGADVAKALALGADAVAIGTAALIALGDNHPRYAAEYKKLGSAAGFFDDFQDGTDPAGISTQDPELSARFDPVEGGRRLANYLRVLTMEAQTIARACGKAHVLHLEPEDLVAVTIEAAAMARVPLAGTDWIPGR
jgi:glutamate synthase domain-containing protein 2